MTDQYVVWPGTHYPGDATTYPYTTGTVADDVTEVLSPAGSVWEIVTDEEMLALSDALQACIGSTEAVAGEMEIPLNKLIESRETVTVDLAVVQELWTRIMRADTGEFMKIRADLIGANSITSDHLQVGVLDGQIVTGATVRTSAGFPRVEMNDQGLVAYNSSGERTVEITTDSATITGATFRTSEGATRTEMSQDEGLRVIVDGETRFQAHHSWEFGVGLYEPLSGELRSPSEVVFGPTVFHFEGMKTCTNCTTASTGAWNQWDWTQYGFYAPCSRAIVIASVDTYNGWGVPYRVAITARFKAGAGSADVPDNGFSEYPLLDSGHGTPLGPNTSEEALKYTSGNGLANLPYYSSINMVEFKKGYYYWPRIQVQIMNPYGTDTVSNAEVAASCLYGNARITIIPC